MRYSALLGLITIVFLSACSSGIRREARGYTQGTTYSVIYYGGEIDFQYQIDSILLSFDRVLSTYQESSYISKWNKNVYAQLEQPELFRDVVRKALEINQKTQGALDITVAPLMRYWFENDWGTQKIDSALVDSILRHVGIASVLFDGQNYVKTDPLIKLDVNAIAQGYSVDVLAKFLDSHGIENYLVEIGGEVRASGTKPSGASWAVGIDLPTASRDDQTLAQTVQLRDKSLATSGNYRKYVMVDRQKFGHSLDPITGYPARTDLLSATVIADDCMTADGYATALMVMGFEKAKKLINEDPGLEALLIYTSGDTMAIWRSDGVGEMLAKVPPQ